MTQKKLIRDLQSKNFKGVEFREISFIPKSTRKKSLNSKYMNTRCSGVELIVKDKEEIFPLEIAVYLLDIIYKNHPKDFKFINDNFIDKLYGSDKLRLSIINNHEIISLIQSWRTDVYEQFLLY